MIIILLRLAARIVSRYDPFSNLEIVLSKLEIIVEKERQLQLN